MVCKPPLERARLVGEALVLALELGVGVVILVALLSPRVQETDFRADLRTLGEQQLNEFQEIIDMENPDLFKWLTGQAPVPDDVGNPLLRTLCEDLRLTMVRALS